MVSFVLMEFEYYFNRYSKFYCQVWLMGGLRSHRLILQNDLLT